MKKLLLLCVIIILVKFSKSQDYLNHTFFKYHQTPNVLKYYAENLNSESSSVIERSNPDLWQGSNLVLPEKFKNEQFLPGIMFNNTRPIPLLYWLLPKETLGKSSLKKLYKPKSRSSECDCQTPFFTKLSLLIEFIHKSSIYYFTKSSLGCTYFLQNGFLKKNNLTTSIKIEA